jgi:hypothetical protein
MLTMQPIPSASPDALLVHRLFEARVDRLPDPVLDASAIAIELADESDLPELSRIAEHNFHSSRNYENLPRDVVSHFAERNSAENLRKKLHSGLHKCVVARERASRRPVGFAIFKILNDKCMLGTRVHVVPEFSSLRLGTKMQRFMLDLMRREGFELLYGDLSGEAARGFFKVGFLYVDSFANQAIKGARIDRVVMDVHADSGRALAESAFLRYLSDASPYAIFLEKYGLLVERLFRKIERMHQTGSSNIRQSVFAHVENGLLLIRELRQHLGRHLLAPIRWEDVEMMWLFHDIGEIGMDSDIPSYKKTKLDSLNEERKASRIPNSIHPRELRAKLVDLHDRYGRRKSRAGSASRTEVDREAALCAFVDKLEASLFIGTSGIGEVWKKRAGRWILQRILKKHALGAFLEPAKELACFLDQRGRAYLHGRLAVLLAAYHDRGLISKAFFDERAAAIEAALAGPHW